MDIRKLAAEGRTEEIERQLMDLSALESSAIAGRIEDSPQFLMMRTASAARLWEFVFLLFHGTPLFLIFHYPGTRTIFHSSTSVAAQYRLEN